MRGEGKWQKQNGNESKSDTRARKNKRIEEKRKGEIQAIVQGQLGSQRHWGAKRARERQLRWMHEPNKRMAKVK